MLCVWSDVCTLVVHRITVCVHWHVCDVLCLCNGKALMCVLSVHMVVSVAWCDTCGCVNCEGSDV